MPALLLGSISTIADTSELQRRAFNRAFAQHGLDWEWGRDEYRSLLTGNGGADRIAAYAEQRGDEVDVAAVHRTKSEIFQETLGLGGLPPRPGVVETVAAAREDGWLVGLVTTTSRGNVESLLRSVDGLSEADFDLVTDVDTVEHSKPHPDVYRFAVDKLSVEAGDCVAVEDNLGGVRAATEAGVACVAFPNANTAGHDFGDTPLVVSLSLHDVRAANGDVR